MPHAIGHCSAVVVRLLRKVPEECPACGSHRLSPQRGFHEDYPDDELEWPACDKCDWVGEAVLIEKVPREPEDDRPPPEGDHVLPAVPLRTLMRPRARQGVEQEGREDGL